MKLPGDTAFEFFSFSRIVLEHAPLIWRNERGGAAWQTTISGHYNLWYALRGTGDMYVDGLHYPVVPGVAFVLGPGQQIRLARHREQPVENFAAHFNPLDESGSVVKPAVFPLAGVTVSDSALFTSAAQHVTRLGAEPQRSGWPLAAGWVLMLITQLLKDAQGPLLDPQDRHILAIAQRTADAEGRRVSVTQMAREAGLSRSQFTRRFIRAMGEAPIDYLVRRRVERAAQLIEQSPYSLGHIAELLGYNDLYFFSRQFKQVTGVAPSHLRTRRTSRR